MLEALASSLPELFPFVQSAYGSPSHLWLGDEVLSSEEGVQQGDPLGPLLFSLTEQLLLVNSQCELTSGYLNDFGLGDQLSHLGRRIHDLESEALKLGLTLNHAKCEVFGLSPSDVITWRDLGLNFIITERRDATFLGAPLSPEGVESAIAEQGSRVRALTPRLCKMASHEAFHLLKTCFAVPKVQYLLRSTPAFAAVAVADLSVAIREALSAVTNIQLDDTSWLQASLPVR